MKTCNFENVVRQLDNNPFTKDNFIESCTYALPGLTVNDIRSAFEALQARGVIIWCEEAYEISVDMESYLELDDDSLFIIDIE